MADWKKSLRQASFKGISFEVKSANMESGRRGQLHEFPGKDVPYFEDLGKKAEHFTIEAFIIGSDYQKRRNALKYACLEYGRGELVHPTYGSIDCICTSCSISENVSDRGMCTFTLTFVESGLNTFTDSTDHADVIKSLSERLENEALESFDEDFNTDDLSLSAVEHVLESVNSAVDNTLNLLAECAYMGNEVLDMATDAVDSVITATDRLFEIKSSYVRILKTPSILSSRISSALKIASSLFKTGEGGNANTAFHKTASMKIYNKSTEHKRVRSAEAVKAEICSAHISVLNDRLNLCNMAKAVSDMNFASKDEAIEIARVFIQQSDKLLNLEQVSADSTSETVKTLKKAVLEKISAQLQKLPLYKSIYVKESTPVVVLAYEIYEDIGRGREIAKRNNIRHPLFVEPGEVEVMCD